MAAQEAVLLDRWIRRRDAEAFRELVERYSGMVYGTARRILRSPDRAEDVAQECFLKLAQSAKSRKRSISGWLHRVSTNLAISQLRTQARRRRAESAHATNHTTPEEVSWREVEPWIDTAIEALPPEQRVPVVEHFLRGRTHEAIARELRVTRSAVGYRIRTGIASIRAFLKKRGLTTTTAVIAGGIATLHSSAVHAVPQSVAASLGKIALGGGPLARKSHRCDCVAPLEARYCPP
jgi:RNA polymerase sigma-70 factor (ECF subfamily)